MSFILSYLQITVIHFIDHSVLCLSPETTTVQHTAIKSSGGNFECPVDTTLINPGVYTVHVTGRVSVAF